MSESVGSRLRQARELRRLTVEQASEATKVRPYYIQALENDDYTAIPSSAQARGFLRIYAEFLQLDPAGLIPPGPPAAAVDASTDDAAAQAARPTLWDTLRERFARRASQQPALQQEAMPEQGGEFVATPATADAKTTRRPKDGASTASAEPEAATDVKKKAVQ